MTESSPALNLYKRLHLFQKLALGLGVSGAAEGVAGTALLLHGGFSHNVTEQKIGIGMLFASVPSLSTAIAAFTELCIFRTVHINRDINQP